MSFFKIEPKIYGAWGKSESKRDNRDRTTTYGEILMCLNGTLSQEKDEVKDKLPGEVVKSECEIVKDKLSSTVLTSVDEVLEYEEEIVGIHKQYGYSRNGRNGCLLAITRFCRNYNIDITDDVNLDDIVNGIFWV